MSVRIARVFPRRNRATPTDDLAFTEGPGLFPPEVDEVHVSVAFTWDKSRAEMLAEEWSGVAPVKIGGPAYEQPGGEFVPGRYLKPGYTITSRGCPNRCWFCSVWKREPRLTELQIQDGWNILDDNLLACSEPHIRAVFAMLKRQKKRAEFTGGLEAKLLLPWHVDLLLSVRVQQMFFAYDTPDDREPLIQAGEMLDKAGYGWREKRCYVLIGHPRDTIDKARERMEFVCKHGFGPMAMLWRGPDDKERPREWKRFQREWTRPAIINAKMKDRGGCVCP